MICEIRTHSVYTPCAMQLTHPERAFVRCEDAARVVVDEIRGLPSLALAVCIYVSSILTFDLLIPLPLFPRAPNMCI
jgi:hypothetical protein